MNPAIDAYNQTLEESWLGTAAKDSLVALGELAAKAGSHLKSAPGALGKSVREFPGKVALKSKEAIIGLPGAIGRIPENLAKVGPAVGNQAGKIGVQILHVIVMQAAMEIAFKIMAPKPDDHGQGMVAANEPRQVSDAELRNAMVEYLNKMPDPIQKAALRQNQDKVFTEVRRIAGHRGRIREAKAANYNPHHYKSILDNTEKVAKKDFKVSDEPYLSAIIEVTKKNIAEMKTNLAPPEIISGAEEILQTLNHKMASLKPGAGKLVAGKGKNKGKVMREPDPGLSNEKPDAIEAAVENHKLDPDDRKLLAEIEKKLSGNKMAQLEDKITKGDLNKLSGLVGDLRKRVEKKGSAQDKALFEKVDNLMQERHDAFDAIDKSIRDAKVANAAKKLAEEEAIERQEAIDKKIADDVAKAELEAKIADHVAEHGVHEVTPAEGANSVEVMRKKLSQGKKRPGGPLQERPTEVTIHEPKSAVEVAPHPGVPEVAEPALGQLGTGQAPLPTSRRSPLRRSRPSTTPATPATPAPKAGKRVKVENIADDFEGKLQQRLLDNSLTPTHVPGTIVTSGFQAHIPGSSITGQAKHAISGAENAYSSHGSFHLNSPVSVGGFTGQVGHVTGQNKIEPIIPIDHEAAARAKAAEDVKKAFGHEAPHPPRPEVAKSLIDDYHVAFGHASGGVNHGIPKPPASEVEVTATKSAGWLSRAEKSIASITPKSAMPKTPTEGLVAGALGVAAIYAVAQAARKLHDHLTKEDPNSVQNLTDSEISRMIRSDPDKYFTSIDVAQMKMDGKYAQRKIQATVEELRKIDAEKRNSGWNRLGNLFHSEVDRKKMYEVHQQNPLTLGGKVASGAKDAVIGTGKNIAEWSGNTISKVARDAGKHVETHMKMATEALVYHAVKVVVTSVMSAAGVSQEWIEDNYPKFKAPSSQAAAKSQWREEAEKKFIKYFKDLEVSNDPKLQEQGKELHASWDNSSDSIKGMIVDEIERKIKAHKANPGIGWKGFS